MYKEKTDPQDVRDAKDKVEKSPLTLFIIPKTEKLYDPTTDRKERAE